MTDKTETDIENLKYLRVGWIDQGRSCDLLLKHVINEFPEATHKLPTRWKWKDSEQFSAKYGRAIWAQTASFSMLMIHGHHVLRFWTDSPKTCIVDVNPALAAMLTSAGFAVESVPESVFRKTKPLTQRVRLTTAEQAVTLSKLARKVYGLDS